MRQAMLLVAGICLALGLGAALAGPAALFVVLWGALALMALLIAATFFWLYRARATPLALGMALSWLGAGLFAGWGWATGLAGVPGQALPLAATLAGLALSLAGAVLHFAVIQRSFGFRGLRFLWPVALALGLSALIYLAA